MIKKYNSLLTINVTILTLGFFIYVLYIGAPIIIPFVVAVLLSFIIISLSSFFHYYGLHKYLSFLASLIVIALIFLGVGKIINTNITEIRLKSNDYQETLVRITSDIATKYNIDEKIITDQFIKKIDIPLLLSSTAALVTSIVKNAGMILFFTIFILLESKSFRKKLAIITGWEKSSFFYVFQQIQSDMKSYFKIKTIISICVALLSAAIMYSFKLDFFVFFAFIIFVLNYIPNVGSIIAVFFPVLFSLIQFESFYVTIMLLLLMIAVQVLMGNLIEPRLMWNRLNLSPLVILVSLIFWWTLWWPIGMLLSVPIMVMINIILAHIEVTRPIAILLSERGIIKFSWMWKIPTWKFSIKKMRKFLKK